MTLEEVGTGWKLTYKVVGPTAAASTVSTVLTPLDGKEAPVLINGEPSGQTMAIKRIDSRHTVTVVSYQGKERSVAKSEISPNGKVLTVETDYATSNPIKLAGKQIDKHRDGTTGIYIADPFGNAACRKSLLSGAFFSVMYLSGLRSDSI